MRKRFRTVLIVASAAITAVVLVAIAGGAGAAQRAAAYRAPRLPGTAQPNLNGMWQALNTAYKNLEAHDAQPARILQAGAEPGYPPVPAAPVLALGAIGGIAGGASVVDGGEIPYQAWAAATRKENAQNALVRDPETKCFMPGVPRAMYMPHPFQIVHAPDAILMAFEYANAVRRVHMTG